MVQHAKPLRVTKMTTHIATNRISNTNLDFLELDPALEPQKDLKEAALRVSSASLG